MASKKTISKTKAPPAPASDKEKALATALPRSNGPTAKAPLCV